MAPCKGFNVVNFKGLPYQKDIWGAGKKRQEPDDNDDQLERNIS